ncbi:MAG: UPF0149 family protein [Pseudomonadales bacterium]|nr:UPF0149 family protein [Pseudomonadales bacterium]
MASITHEQLSARLQELQLPVAADVLHGALVGLACAGLEPGQEAWLAQLASCLEDVDVASNEAMLSALQTLIGKELADGELGFQLLLPDSEEFLSVRVQALARWSDSFIYAFVATARELSQEDREVLEDIAAISQVDDGEIETENAPGLSALNNPEEADSNERDFMELCEYVRMAAMDLYREASSGIGGEQQGALQ